MMHRIMRAVTVLALAAMNMPTLSHAAVAQETEQPAGDPGAVAYRAALSGKRIVLVPMSMSFDLAQAWGRDIGSEVAAFGGVFETRDPNWEIDAGAQAIADLVAAPQKPSALIVQPPDLASYASVFKRAQEAGIFVIQLGNRANAPTDVFVGPNWTEVGELEAKAAIQGCGATSSHRIGLIRSDQTSSSSIDQFAGIQKVLKDNPDFSIAGTLDSNRDAASARTAATTLVQQHPDICALINLWSGDAAGTAAALREASLHHKVFLVTNGGAEAETCKNIADGTYGAVVVTDLPDEARAVGTALKLLLQSGLKPGQGTSYIYTPASVATKTDAVPRACPAAVKSEAPKRR